jgi:serine O-acetyltransferase
MTPEPIDPGRSRFSMTLTKDELACYVAEQLRQFFPDRHAAGPANVKSHLSQTLERLLTCFGAIRRKYFFDGQSVLFDHLQSEQYAMFLYILGNTVYRQKGDLRLAAKLYYLNKILHGLDVWYEVALPPIFLFRHCVGTVLGRAQYADYFSVGQNCTVGNNHGIYPVFGQKVAMYNGSMIVGRCHVGSNVHISAQTVVRDQDIPGDTVVYGVSPHLVFKPVRQSVLDRFFNMF